MIDFSTTEALTAIRAVVTAAGPLPEDPPTSQDRALPWASLVRLDPVAGGRARLEALFARLDLSLTDPVDCRPHLRWPRAGRSSASPLLLITTLRRVVLVDNDRPVDGLLALRSLAGALELEPLAVWLGESPPEGWDATLDPAFLEELIHV